jgi:hypothetical protein
MNRSMVSSRTIFYLLPIWLTCPGVIISLLSIARQFDSPRDTTVPEGSIVYSIRFFREPYDLYRDFSQPPYATTPYTPGYYLLAALASGLDRNLGVATTYRIGRAISIAALAVALAAASILCRNIGESGLGAMSAAFLVSTLPYFSIWTATCRPDMLALAFSITGLAFTTSHLRGATVFAILCLSVAILTKQSYCAATATAVAWSLICGHWRRGVTFALGVGAIVMTAFVVCELWTGGQFISNVITANVAPTVPTQACTMILRFCSIATIPLLFACLRILFDIEWQAQPWTIETIYLMLSWLVAVASSIKAGADLNYFIEPGMALSIFAVVHWGRLSRLVSASRGASVVCMGSMLIGVASLVWNPPWTSLSEAESGESQQRVFKFINSLDRPALIGDAGMAIRAGQTIWILDKFNASYLQASGLIDCAELVERIERREFAVIVSDVAIDAELQGCGWWPRDARISIEKNYPVKRLLGRSFIYFTEDFSDGELNDVP